MSLTRRWLLGAAGLSAIALATKPALDTLGLEIAPPPADDGAGTRWAMAIDVRRCAAEGDCTTCLRACHEAHNVPVVADRARRVDWIWRERFETVFPTVAHAHTPDALREAPTPVLCNHCDDPPCVRVCPTRATWKRADGITMMDWHRCIGCRYCMAACPYAARSFNWTDPRACLPHPTAGYPTRTAGVVEKCTFCEERLADGDAPRCVAACPVQALVFGNLNDPESGIRALLGGRLALRRRAELGTGPAVYYVV